MDNENKTVLGLSESIDNHDSISSIEERSLVRKIDLFLLPTIWLMYLLSYIDRTKFVPSPFLSATANLPSIGNAKIAGLQSDLHLSSSQFSVALVVFFVSYVVFEVPSK